MYNKEEKEVEISYRVDIDNLNNVILIKIIIKEVKIRKHQKTLKLPKNFISCKVKC